MGPDDMGALMRDAATAAKTAGLDPSWKMEAFRVALRETMRAALAGGAAGIGAGAAADDLTGGSGAGGGHGAASDDNAGVLKALADRFKLPNDVPRAGRPPPPCPPAETANDRPDGHQPSDA